MSMEKHCESVGRIFEQRYYLSGVVAGISTKLRIFEMCPSLAAMNKIYGIY